MITPQKFLNITRGNPEDPRREQKNFDGTPRLFRLAVVDPTWDGSGWPKVTFEEEDSLSTKEYPYAGVSPGPGQRVVLARIGGTDLILGAIAESGAVGGGYMPAGVPVVFTSSGTFAKASYPGLRAVRVRVQGAGGGGGSTPVTGAAQKTEAAGGGGGGYAKKFILVDDLSASETVTVGTGGAGGTAGGNGSTGGTSSFGAHCSCAGGGGGAGGLLANNVQSSGGSGGTATGGDINLPGGMGFYGVTRIVASTTAGAAFIFMNGFANYGGGSVLGAMTKTTHNFSNDGVSGALYGGGGSGARADVSQATRPGGAGANGAVFVDLFY